MATALLNVPDISCEHCETVVTTALMRLPGVRSVGVDIPAKQVRVSYDDSLATIERMQEALRNEEYPVASVSRG